MLQSSEEEVNLDRNSEGKLYSVSVAGNNLN